MRVMIQLQEDAAMQLQNELRLESPSSEGKSETRKLIDVTTKLGGTLYPVHPGQTHPLLAPFFMVDVPDQKTAEKLINSLQKFKIVEAAYLKPDEQVP